MTKPISKTTIVEDGLRYKAKVSGSPFKATTYAGSATMSCILCGKHRLRNLLGSRKLAGKNHAVCAPSCKELDSQLAQTAA